MMKNRIFLVLFCLIILVGVGVSVSTKASINSNSDLGNLDGYSDFTLNLSEIEGMDIENPYFNEVINSVSELESQSKLIVKVSKIVKREQVSRATLTTVKVDEVIKGDLDVDEILIYEPSYFWTYQDDKSQGYFPTEGYQIMQDGNQYVLFLQGLKVPEAYRMSDEEKRSYLPISQQYGKFPVESSEWEPQIVKSDGMIYEDFQVFELLTKKEKVLQRYLELKNEVIETYK